MDRAVDCHQGPLPGQQICRTALNGSPHMEWVSSPRKKILGKDPLICLAAFSGLAEGLDDSVGFDRLLNGLY